MRELANYGATSAEEESAGIRVILESESWRFISHKAHLGLYNKSGRPREYTLKITEMKDSEMLPDSLRVRFEYFEKLFKRTDAS